MRPTMLLAAPAALCVVLAATMPAVPHSELALAPYPQVLDARDSSHCTNGPNSRKCWGNYDINTDYYTTWPSTGVTRQFSLEVMNITLSPDGFPRQVLAFNGQIPGPAITADWGDMIEVTVKNSLEENGTATHWHGVRQLNSNEYDGVPGVSQCPIPPGQSMTYRFQATQYGSSWYHSHFSLQLGDGLFGPINIRGPVTADYDEDLGSLFIQDWAHETAFDLWAQTVRYGNIPALANGLINGTNTYNCTPSDGPSCSGGARFATTFEPGKRYLLRLVSSAIDAFTRFSIDGHNLTVVAADFVPVRPWSTPSVTLASGQRYDVVVAASADPARAYWLRADYPACNDAANGAGSKGDIRGVVRYAGDASAPDSQSALAAASLCGDEDAANLVPWVAWHVGRDGESGAVALNVSLPHGLAAWTLNSSSLRLNWSQPTDLDALQGVSQFPTAYDTYALPGKNQ